MSTLSFGERARRFVEQASATDTDEPANEISEKNEETPGAGELISSNSFVSYPPLDDTIIASEAAKHSAADIERRLARLVTRAADSAATPLDHQLVRDWTAIRNAKLAREESAA